MIIQLLMINNKFVGQREYKHPIQDWRPYTNKLYLCPHCGTIWAKVMYMDTENPEHNFRFMASHIPCAEHGGGSILSAYNHNFNEALPRTREFLLHELNLLEQKKDLYWFDGYERRP